MKHNVKTYSFRMPLELKERLDNLSKIFLSQNQP